MLSTLLLPLAFSDLVCDKEVVYLAGQPPYQIRAFAVIVRKDEYSSFYIIRLTNIMSDYRIPGMQVGSEIRAGIRELYQPLGGERTYDV
jgi:hypothetical protein